MEDILFVGGIWFELVVFAYENTHFLSPDNPTIQWTLRIIICVDTLWTRERLPSGRQDLMSIYRESSSVKSTAPDMVLMAAPSVTSRVRI